MGPPRADADRSGVRVTPEIVAEASVWVARLHGPDRSPQMERECLAWQARSAAHREAFERCTETWQDVANVTVANAFAASKDPATGRASGRATPLRWAYGVALAGLLVGGVILVQYWMRLGEYETDVGEQRQVVLGDGTRMTLNTDTQVRVEMGAVERSVRVVGGEALFEVAKDARRPFVVRVPGNEVVAVGTVFAVRLTPDREHVGLALAVILLEGQVTVRPAPTDGGPAAQAVVMQPGDRVRIASARRWGTEPPAVDKPVIEQAVAWRRSEVLFDGASLGDAVAEMNRYSRTPIVLVDQSGLATLRVGGVFRTGDNVGFARAVAALHGLAVTEYQGRLQLAKPH